MKTNPAFPEVPIRLAPLHRTKFQLALAVLLLTGLGCAGADFKFRDQVLTVPDGFEIELVAENPLVERPIAADFDDQGRLYVSDSSGSNDAPEKQLELKPHRIVRLTDSTGNGRYNESTVFADRMMFPAGAMWLDGSFYVGAPPSIWKLTDTNGDGVADQRAEWMQGKTLTGCANDLHGPYTGPDGWIYWAKGAFAQQTYERPGQPPFVTRAAHIFRCRPDGSGIEAVMTGGMDNPVAVVFTPTGERIITATFLQNPQDGKRDGLIHALYGGVYGKVNEVTDEHRRTGDLLPVLSHLGAAAPCGLARYASDSFGPDYRDNLFTCSFNLHKVIRHVLTPEGATYRSKESDFLVSNNPDFHPTDVREDADGSLLVVDTGGWYKLCCPTSQLAKPDVLGAIYRIRRTGAPQVEDARGLHISWEKLSASELTALLADSRPAVRNRAIAQLGKQGRSSVPALEEYIGQVNSAEGHRNAVWSLTRIDAVEARRAVRSALTPSHDSSLRHVALNSIALWRDADALDAVISCLADPDLAIRRIAAEALGRIGDPRAVPALLQAAAQLAANERILEHSLTFALIEIADAGATALGATSNQPHARRVALIALDQMPRGKLAPSEVTPLLTSTDPLLRQTANWIVDQHRDWGSALKEFFLHQLQTELRPAEADSLEQQLARSAKDATVRQLIGECVAKVSLPLTSRITAIRAMARAGLKETPADWLEAVSSVLGSTELALKQAGVTTARSLARPSGDNSMDRALRQIAGDPNAVTALRLEALASIKNLGRLDPEFFSLAASQLDPSLPLPVRSNAATVLASAKLGPAQLLSVADLLAVVGPLELNKLIGAFKEPLDEPTANRLLDRLAAAKALSGLRTDVLKTVTAILPENIRPRTLPLFARLNVDVEKQKQHLDDLLSELKAGDVRRGQAVFNNPQFACSSCHAIGYSGGHIGPDLTTVGTIRTERDLLESIVYPSASFVRSFEPYRVTTKSGEVLGGLLRKDAPNEILLVAGPGAETTIARADLIEMSPGTISVMPQGLDQLMSKQELADLLAFLKATTWGAR